VTRPTIHEIGEALYGSRWQSELARALDMSERHMRRLASGQARVTAGIHADIARTARMRLKEIEHVVKLIEKGTS
jgi:hypothetical protein